MQLVYRVRSVLCYCICVVPIGCGDGSFRAFVECSRSACCSDVGVTQQSPGPFFYDKEVDDKENRRKCWNLPPCWSIGGYISLFCTWATTALTIASAGVLATALAAAASITFAPVCFAWVKWAVFVPSVVLPAVIPMAFLCGPVCWCVCPGWKCGGCGGDGEPTYLHDIELGYEASGDGRNLREPPQGGTPPAASVTGKHGAGHMAWQVGLCFVTQRSVGWETVNSCTSAW